MGIVQHAAVSLRTLSLCVALTAVVACSGGGGSTPASTSNLPASPGQPVEKTTTLLPLQGAAVKGPMIFATILVYELNTSLPGLYDPNTPVATAISGVDATFGGIMLPTGRSYVLVVDGTQAIDLDTHKSPVIPKLVTLVTADNLAKQQPVTATPLTTLGFEIAKRRIGQNASPEVFASALVNASRLIRSTLIYGIAPQVDLYTSPVLPTQVSPTVSQIDDLLKHRAAIEYISALLVRLGQDRGVTTNDMISILAHDLAHDGIIDDHNGATPLNSVNLDRLSEIPATLTIPNTAFKVSDMARLLEVERQYLAPSMSRLTYPTLRAGRLLQNSDLDDDGILNVDDLTHFGASSLTSIMQLTAGQTNDAYASNFGPNSEFHNHIHNFFVNDWNKASPNYFLAAKHAAAMRYSLVSSRAKPTGRTLDPLGLIKDHNAYYAPMRFDFNSKQVWYFDWYDNGTKISPLRTTRNVNVWQSWDAGDFGQLLTYGCSKTTAAPALNENTTMTGLANAYYTGWTFGNQTNVIVNFMSRAVVDNLVNITIQSMKTGKYQTLFIDDLPREMPNCANMAVGGKGSYSSWKEGQKDFIKRVADGLRSTVQNTGMNYKIFGNIWSPKLPMNQRTILKWYADGSLRLDHYYYEKGAIEGETIEANGIDPATGLPAYTSTDGYLPANLLSVAPPHQWYQSLGNPVTAATYAARVPEFFQHTLSATGVAARQGSWFGWYGENSVQNRDPNNALIFTNDLQLLKAIPNWDNLAGVPLSARKFDVTANIYQSPTSYASPHVIYARRYDTGELYAVYRSNTGTITLPANTRVITAKFADEVFTAVGQDATSCLKQQGNTLSLICSDKFGIGIRIRLGRL